MSPRSCFFLIFTLFFLAGCESQKEQTVIPKQGAPAQERPSAEIKTAIFLQEPVNTLLVETATEALSPWREYASAKPALVLFSSDPFLEPIPAKLQKQAMELVRNGTTEQVKTRAVDITPNPLLLHSMAVDAAIKAGFFSEVIWILPSKDEVSPPSLESFRKILAEGGLISQEEAKTLVKKENLITGTFRNTPVTISNLSAIPSPKSHAWVHFDLSFFKPLYKNEVSTPLYPLILDALKKIRVTDLRALGATISYSNLGGDLSLKIRFIGKDLAHLISHPDSIDASIPELQYRRSQNLYLEQFIKTTEIMENSLRMEALAPKDAAVKFDLYNVHRTLNKGNLAIGYLDQAVALDSVYAIEYLNLADTAAAKQRPDAAIEMLSKARTVFPGNPLITLMEANIQVESGNQDSAITLIKELKSLPWSDVYDKDVPNRLAQLEKKAKGISPVSAQ